MDTENIPLDMNAVYAKERSLGFSLPNFISSRLRDLPALLNVNKDLHDFSQDLIDDSPYREEVEQVLDSKLKDFHTENVTVWETHIKPAKRFGRTLGKVTEAFLLTYAVKDSNNNSGVDQITESSRDILRILSTYFAMFTVHSDIASDIPSVVSEVAGNVAARIYKHKSLESRKRDLEEFLRSEGIIHD